MNYRNRVVATKKTIKMVNNLIRMSAQITNKKNKNRKKVKNLRILSNKLQRAGIQMMTRIWIQWQKM